MERLKLNNGKVITCLTTENKDKKVYYCGTHKEACCVSMTLTDIGNKSAVSFGKHGWMVIIRKNGEEEK